jgi:hypothetical protein
MWRELLPLLKSARGSGHPETLLVMQNFAIALVEDGQKEEALKLREAALPLSRALGAKNPETLFAIYQLALSYADAGRDDEALKLREELLPLSREVNGENNPDTLSLIRDLAASYSKAGDRDKAGKLRNELAEKGSPLPPETEPEASDTAEKTAVPAAPPHKSEPGTLVAPDSQWKWLHPVDGKDPAESIPAFHTTFFMPGFDDSKWHTGRDSDDPDGGFGYGPGFKGVNIEKPEDMAHRRTAYFRHSFKTGKPCSNLELSCRRDDGIVVYLDGREILRDNVQAGPDAYKLSAATTVDPGDERIVHRFPIAGTLRPGSHILAISVHNTSQPSADLRLGGVTLKQAEGRKMNSR